MWETDVGDVGNAVGKQKNWKVGKQKIRTVGSRKQESRNVEKQESRKVGKQESRKVGKVVKVEKSGKQGSKEEGSTKQEV